MNYNETRDERRSALDEFANMKTDASQGALATQPASSPPATQVYGAQAVAVHRDEASILQKIKVLAAAAGSEWFYRFPVKDKGKTSWIEGPSIKLANDVARLYGNVEIDCRAQDLGSAIMFHARFVDLETGYALTRPFQQRKGASKLGGGDEGRREDITFQIGASKAIRNVVVNALQTFSDFAFEEARNALVEKIGNDIEKWRRNVSERIGARVDLKRVEAVIGRTADKWLAPDIARVVAMGKAVEDGMSTWDETFPPLGVAASDQGEKINTKALDQFAQTEVDQGGADGPSAGSTETAADDRTTSVAVERLGIVNRLLGIATDERPLDDKLERLDHFMRDLVDEQPAHEAFIKEAAQMAAKVARKDVTLAVARDWLKGAK
jgi:hypothetical protein